MSETDCTLSPTTLEILDRWAIRWRDAGAPTLTLPAVTKTTSGRYESMTAHLWSRRRSQATPNFRLRLSVASQAHTEGALVRDVLARGGLNDEAAIAAQIAADEAEIARRVALAKGEVTA